MNIDFHYGVIYILARKAGFECESAETIAHACQYVDDSTVTGVLDFAGGESFDRFASAHEMYDYLNWKSDNAKRVWAPFHFLPACVGNTLDEKCVCRPNSEPAREMVREAIRQKDAENALHRLGMTLHVYVDTWAHQGFTGTLSPNNVVKGLKSDAHDPSHLMATLRNFLEVAEETTESEMIDVLSKLGHGAALHLPDLPWAKWEYTNGHGEHKQRDNLPQFVEAADMAFRALKGFQRGVEDFTGIDGLPVDVRQALEDLLRESRSDDCNVRLTQLANAVTHGQIPGLKEDIPEYVPKGKGSWKYIATGITSATNDGSEKPSWTPKFELSDYRKFHDAVKAHRAYITGVLLPARGVRLA